jgi:hypothetical protein
MKRRSYDISKEEEKDQPPETLPAGNRLVVWWKETRQNMKLILYNKETGQYLTRTPRSWAEIGLFYLVFYSALTSFFAICMVVFLDVTVPSKDEGPKFNHIICVEPGWKKSFSGDLVFTMVGQNRVAPEADNLNAKTREFLREAGYTADKQNRYSLTQNPKLTSCNGPQFIESHEMCVFFRFNRITGYVPHDDVRVGCTSTSTLTSIEHEGKYLDTDPSKPVNNRTLIISPHPLERAKVAFNPSDPNFRSALFIAKFFLKPIHYSALNNAGQSHVVSFICVPILNGTGALLDGDISPIEFNIKYVNAP